MNLKCYLPTTVTWWVIFSDYFFLSFLLLDQQTWTEHAKGEVQVHVLY